MTTRDGPGILSITWVVCTLKLRTQGRHCCFCHLRKWTMYCKTISKDSLLDRFLINMAGSHLGSLTSSVHFLVSDFKLTWTLSYTTLWLCLPNSKADSHHDFESRISDKPHLLACWRIELAPELICTHSKVVLPLALTFYFLWINQPTFSLSIVHSYSRFWNSRPVCTLRPSIAS